MFSRILNGKREKPKTVTKRFSSAKTIEIFSVMFFKIYLVKVAVSIKVSCL